VTETEPDNILKPWWEPVDIEVEQIRHYAVGPVSVYLQRRQSEWLLAWENFPDSEDYYRVISEAVSEIPQHLTVNRYVFQRPPRRFRLKPRLLDRPIVVKTNQPVRIPSGESITFFISSPVCVSVELQDPDTVLQELDTLRLSDTWFGPSTRVGELCYATKTHARNEKSDMPLRPHRAVTPVNIRNQSDAILAIEKLSIPVPFLRVYGHADGTLWTEPVSLEHTEDNQLAKMEIGRQPAGAVALAEARTPPARNNVVRAFISMFAE
tara:strand:- start:39 stop:836 length:798 start_codon:yes stop_codon:yes gene_type:complete